MQKRARPRNTSSRRSRPASVTQTLRAHPNLTRRFHSASYAQIDGATPRWTVIDEGGDRGEDAGRAGSPGARTSTTEDIAMTTRRDFLQIGAGTLAGLAFVGCDLLAARPAATQPRRREVVVNGRRVKTVDVHAHCAVPEALSLMNLKLGGAALPPVLHVATQAADRIRAMDEQGIDVEALSINPFWYKAERDLARQIISVQNEKL